MIVLFIVSFLLGTIPIKLNQWFQWTNEAKHSVLVKFLLGIGGGVLLCTTFIHLLPEVQLKFQSLHVYPYVKSRFAEILLCLGFFAMYLIEECVHSYLHYKEKHMRLLRRSLLIRRGEPLETLLKLEEQEVQAHQHEGHSHTVHFDSGNTTAVVRGLVIILALSIHELFEGLAVGLESSSNTVWYMFGAINAHKQVIAFCIGIELVTSDLKSYLIIIYVFIFSIVSPIGIGVGILVCTYNHSTTFVGVILQGLASGTLVYVVFFEILQGEKKRGLLQYFSIVIGFGIMFVITLLEVGHVHE